MELILHFVILAVSIILFAITYLFQGLSIETGGGPAFWPRILLILIIVLEVIVIFHTYKKVKNGKSNVKKDEDSIYPNNLYITILALTVYIIAMKYIGFFISTVAFLIFMMVVLKVKLKINLFVSIASGVAITFLFGNLLMVPLPAGMGIFRIISGILT